MYIKSALNVVHSCLYSGSRSGVNPNTHHNIFIINVVCNILYVRYQEEAKNQVYLQSLVVKLMIISC